MNRFQSFLALIPGRGGEGNIGMGSPGYFALPNHQFISGGNLQEDLWVIVDRRELCDVNHPDYCAPTYLYLQIDILLNHNQRSESCLAENAIKNQLGRSQERDSRRNAGRAVCCG